MKTEFAREEKAAAEAVKAGEQALLKHFHPDRIIPSKYKAHKEFVTAADLASNRAIQAVLRKLAPDIPVVSEEGSLYQSADQLASRLQWILDPLDGTTNFLIGLPLWGISLALLQDGEPVIGWLSLPMMKEKYEARLNQGAWKKGKTAYAGDAFDPAIWRGLRGNRVGCDRTRELSGHLWRQAVGFSGRHIARDRSRRIGFETGWNCVEIRGSGLRVCKSGGV